MGQAPPPAAPAAPAAPAGPVAPGTLIRLANEADKAFSDKNYTEAIAKLEEVIRGLGPNNKSPQTETVYFYLGLANLLADKPVEAEAAFTDCLKRFPPPKGEFASRCYLGVGRACIDQDTPEKKETAIKALKLAAQDPRFRSEAGLWLGQVFNDLGRRDEAMAVFKSLMGSDIRSPQQTSAAVEVLSLLADTGKQEDLVAYLDRLSNQSGIRDAIAWYANQVISQADVLVGSNSYEAALALYRSIPPRNQILETQKASLESMRKDVGILEKRVIADSAKPLEQRSNAPELLNALKPAVELAGQALTAIEEKTDLDAALLIRRGRCLYNLHRFEEALVCYRAIRTKHGTSGEAKHGAYAEILILRELKKIPEIKALCDAYLRKYPDADNVEQVASLAGELMVQNGNWAEVAPFYAGLVAKFPNSENLDRFIFFQALAHFMDANFKESTPLFTRFLKDFPNSVLYEKGLYFMAMSNFLQGAAKYKETLKSCKEYLSKFPEGEYAGDMRYRLAFIDFNDKDEDQTSKIIRDLTAFLIQHPEDSSAGSMLCLLGDTYKKKTSDKPDELAKFENSAIESYKKAVWTKSPDDVIQYALDNATSMLQAKKDWSAIAALHGEFLLKYPDSPLALLSAMQVAKMKAREGKSDEAAEMLAHALQPRIGNPAAEQVEALIDELVKTLVPRKKPSEVNLDEVDKKLVDVLTKAIGDQENATTNARVYYARARLALSLRRADRADLYLKGIATSNASTPAVLSPTLLSVCGDILLKLGNLDGAEAMFKRLIDRHKDGMFADAGPVGLGYVALARKKPDEALKIFSDSLENSPGMSRFKETTLGKLEALVAVGKLDDALKLAQETAGDKSFRGEPAGKALLLMAQIYRKQAEKAAGDAKHGLLAQADGVYKKVALAYQSYPDVCAEAYWQDIEVLKELGEKEKADEMLKALREHPKLKNTERAKQAK